MVGLARYGRKPDAIRESLSSVLSMRLNHSQIFIKEAQNARETLIWVLGNPRCTRVEREEFLNVGIIVLQKSEVYKGDSFPWYTKNTVVIGRSWCGTNPDESVGFRK
jgi:hypothetical protein